MLNAYTAVQQIHQKIQILRSILQALMQSSFKSSSSSSSSNNHSQTNGDTSQLLQVNTVFCEISAHVYENTSDKIILNKQIFKYFLPFKN